MRETYFVIYTTEIDRCVSGIRLLVGLVWSVYFSYKRDLFSAHTSPTSNHIHLPISVVCDIFFKISFSTMDVYIGRASLVFILRDVTRFAEFSRRLVQKLLRIIFDPMLSLWVILVCYK